MASVRAELTEPPAEVFVKVSTLPAAQERALALTLNVSVVLRLRNLQQHTSHTTQHCTGLSSRQVWLIN